jgi:hypothetical protein
VVSEIAWHLNQQHCAGIAYTRPRMPATTSRVTEPALAGGWPNLNSFRQARRKILKFAKMVEVTFYTHDEVTFYDEVTVTVTFKLFCNSDL